MLKKDGISHSDQNAKSTILNEQFGSVYPKNLNTMSSMSGRPFPKMEPCTISINGVLKLLRDLNTHKAQGPDTIPFRFLRECAVEIALALTLVFQASVQRGTIPDDWKKPSSSEYSKKETNYKPISLTIICCKTMEHIIHSQVMQHLDTNKILCDQQHGFRKRRSCKSQLLITLQ